MNNDLDHDIKAIFDEIVSHTPPLGDAPDPRVTFQSTADPRSSQWRWTTLAAAALVVVTVAGVLFVNGRRTTGPSSSSSAPITDPTVTPITTVGTTPNTEPTTDPTTDPGGVTTPPETTQAPEAAAKTVLAFSDGGAAVQVAAGQALAEPLFDLADLNDRWEMFDVAFSRNVAFIGTCCEPATGAVYQVDNVDGSPTVQENPANGYGVSISPNERFVAVGGFTGNPVEVQDLQTGEWVVSDPAPGWADLSIGAFTPMDVMWLDDRRLLVTGSMLSDDPNGAEPETVVYDVALDDSGRVTSVSDAVQTGRQADVEAPMTFAGQPEAGKVGLHMAGSSEVLLLDVGAGVPSLGTSVLAVGDGAYQSVWYDLGGNLTTVDSDGTLTVNGAVIPGNYQWARTT